MLGLMWVGLRFEVSWRERLCDAWIVLSHLDSARIAFWWHIWSFGTWAIRIVASMLRCVIWVVGIYSWNSRYAWWGRCLPSAVRVKLRFSYWLLQWWFDQRHWGKRTAFCTSSKSSKILCIWWWHIFSGLCNFLCGTGLLNKRDCLPFVVRVRLLK